MRNTVISFVAILWLCGVVSAQPADTLFTSAGDAYRAGDFRSAIERYESIIAGGVSSAELYYNLGNAYFRSGNVARSVLSYERALLLDPTDDDIRHNLSIARLRTVDRIDPLPELFIFGWVRWLNAVIPLTLTMSLFLAGWGLVFASLIVMYLVRSSGVVRMSRMSFFGGTVLASLFGVLLLLQVLLTPKTGEGVILSPTVTAKSSPDAASVDAFVVHEGLKVVLGDSVEEWRRITLADGKTGWIRGTDLEAL